MTTRFANFFKKYQKDKFLIRQTKDDSDWLCQRKLGGSDAGVIVGVNRYKSRRELYLELIGESENQFSGNAYTEYGKKVEPILRDWFRLQNKDRYKVLDPPKKPIILIDSEHDFLTATLDGYIEDLENDCAGIFEAKSVHMNSPMQFEEWKNRVPDSYYAQVCHYLSITGFAFAILVVEQIYERINNDGETDRWSIIKQYRFDREDCENDIHFLLAKEIEFWNDVQARNEPPDEFRFVSQLLI